MAFKKLKLIKNKTTPRILVLCLFLAAGSKAVYAIETLFAGISPEVNAYSRSGTALGANLVFGMEFDTNFAVGLKTGFFNNTDTISVWNFQLLFRFYPLSKSSSGGLFLQAESGGIFIYEFGNKFPAFSAGISTGWRFDLPHNWYFEPAISLGYPYIWGIELAAGYRFRMGENNG